MIKIRFLFFWTMVAMNFLSGIFARAEDNEVMGFDAVVTQLSSSHKSEERMYDPFADVKIHTSVGLISSFLQVKSDQGGSSHQGTVQGVVPMLKCLVKSTNTYSGPHGLDKGGPP